MLLQPEFTHLELLSTESSVDDLGTCRGVVLRRAVTILRSIETQPLTGRFVRSVGQSSPLFFCSPRYLRQRPLMCGKYSSRGSIVAKLKLKEASESSSRGSQVVNLELKALES